ncbi:hypothetical protein B0H67DRAFT_571240 [Lasiosphaeris hirsuta]|uniref:Uncharacterized protein n=1 Tax=Lasiosphaeris hirsuta TaxID=260670 RepID=A0AA40E2N1_9PEZI|nr:hypothetical protein B0H67DRAFT_571240 [Lasiosphaeris hirsuta]
MIRMSALRWTGWCAVLNGVLWKVLSAVAVWEVANRRWVQQLSLGREPAKASLDGRHVAGGSRSDSGTPSGTDQGGRRRVKCNLYGSPSSSVRNRAQLAPKAER